jgi:LysR family transcriptional regulator, glycine cleavage system transcriptional activator
MIRKTKQLMTRRLTHLNGMRAFEAAARHMSFGKAAEELRVTPAAVSQQIKNLEGYLGVALFKRTKRGILLTSAGQAILPDAREGFDLLSSALSRARKQRARRQLVVTVTPSFAAKWLMPRLEAFIASHPEIEIRLDTTSRLVEFGREDVDVGVRYGAGEWPGDVEITPLLREEVFPVCAAKLLNGQRPLREVGDLRHHTLIHDDSLPGEDALLGWAGWLQAAGATAVDATRGLHVNASMFAIQAAMEGKGIALGRSVLVADDIAEGRLVRPFARAVALRSGYFVVHQRRLPADSNVLVFRKWLISMARASPT